MTQWCHWHCCITETTESKLSGVNDTADQKLSSIIDTAIQQRHRWVSSETFKGSLISFTVKRKSNKIQARVNYTTQGLWCKGLKNGGCLRELLWLSSVIWHRWINFEFEYLSESEVKCKNTWGVKYRPNWRCFMKKKRSKISWDCSYKWHCFWKKQGSSVGQQVKFEWKKLVPV